MNKLLYDTQSHISTMNRKLQKQLRRLTVQLDEQIQQTTADFRGVGTMEQLDAWTQGTKEKLVTLAEEVTGKVYTEEEAAVAAQALAAARAVEEQRAAEEAAKRAVQEKAQIEAAAVLRREQEAEAQKRQVQADADARRREQETARIKAQQEAALTANIEASAARERAEQAKAIQSTAQRSVIQEPERYPVPADTKPKVKLTLRGLQKDVQIPLSFKLSKIVAKVSAQSPIDCALERAVMVVLRKNASLGETYGAEEFGCYSGDSLQWMVCEAGFKLGDIVHVIAPLPQNWRLCEDAADQVFYYNVVTQESAWDTPTGSPETLAAGPSVQVVVSSPLTDTTIALKALPTDCFSEILRRYIQQAPAHMSSAQLDVCLLYTSPSPRDRTRSRMPSSA
eukprot:TRINITY_DN34926_c0_g1_i1.p1 TRINITY_DN34926_c0_g1~~TRINITY_DN34926_c0_g1_i1.p1  ORF type:complete len:395 (-),score=127.29 TRINITY_DN34926_c0_g1_i1:22-1206(-)